MPRDETRREEEGAGGSGGARVWVRRWWRALAAELAATALLVALGVAATLPFEPVRLVHPAMAFGGVVVGNCVAFGPASGAHMNPAVTLAALVQGRLPWGAAAGYAAAQAAGAVLGYGALAALAPRVALSGAAGCTRLAAGLGAGAGVALEALLTAALVLAVCGLWEAHDPARPDHAAPLKLGLLIAGLVFAGGPATGASLNPARSLAPALLQAHWDHLWVYCAGPLLGALLAALLHRAVLAAPHPRTHPRPPRPEELPLNKP